MQHPSDTKTQKVHSPYRKPSDTAGGEGMKKRIASAISRQGKQSMAAQATIADMLLQFGADSLFGQLGYLVKVCCHLVL